MNKKRFSTEQLAIEAWAKRYRPLSENYEWITFVYSVTHGDKKIYFTGRTHRGMKETGPIQPNVILPFLFIYLLESPRYWLQYGAHIEAILHTHPKPDHGFTYRHHSKVDKWLLFLPSIKTVFVIPYENDRLERFPD